jgi:voltage-gated sodium channel
MTLESWSMGIVRPVMIVYPLAWVFFLPFILIKSFAVLNLFIGIIVDAMQQQNSDDKQDLSNALLEELVRTQKSVNSLKKEIDEMKKKMGN